MMQCEGVVDEAIFGFGTDQYLGCQTFEEVFEGYKGKRIKVTIEVIDDLPKTKLDGAHCTYGSPGHMESKYIFEVKATDVGYCILFDDSTFTTLSCTAYDFLWAKGYCDYVLEGGDCRIEVLEETK